MEEKFFGQHIASKLILSALKGNFNRSTQNKKPLVMSFHGWTGSGKNFVTELIANNMFNTEKVKNLRYHVIHKRSDLVSSSELNNKKVHFFSFITKSYSKSKIKNGEGWREL